MTEKTIEKKLAEFGYEILEKKYTGKIDIWEGLLIYVIKSKRFKGDAFNLFTYTREYSSPNSWGIRELRNGKELSDALWDGEHNCFQYGEF